MNKIIIIGTQPQCSRCELLTKIILEKSISMGLNANISHIAYTSNAAYEYARDSGLIPGTAKDVARIANIDINWEEDIVVALEFKNQAENLEQNLKQFKQLFKEVAILDNRLRTFENMAKDMGTMMTPVLIINGKIKHQGSVPLISEIQND